MQDCRRHAGLLQSCAMRPPPLNATAPRRPAACRSPRTHVVSELAVSREGVGETIVGRVPREVADVNLGSHDDEAWRENETRGWRARSCRRDETGRVAERDETRERERASAKRARVESDGSEPGTEADECKRGVVWWCEGKADVQHGARLSQRREARSPWALRWRRPARCPPAAQRAVWVQHERRRARRRWRARQQHQHKGRAAGRVSRGRCETDAVPGPRPRAGRRARRDSRASLLERRVTASPSSRHQCPSLLRHKDNLFLCSRSRCCGSLLACRERIQAGRE